MNLQSYIGKLVKLTLTNNKILIGKVIDFDDKVDNFDGYNSIEIDTGRITYDISENKIKTIFCTFITTKDTRHIPSTISSFKPIDFLSSILNTKFI